MISLCILIATLAGLPRPLFTVEPQLMPVALHDYDAQGNTLEPTTAAGWYRLGCSYYECAVKRPQGSDRGAALYCFEVAGNGGDPRGACMVAVIADARWFGMSDDEIAAFRVQWYAVAAEGGIHYAMGKLTHAYAMGEGVTQDYYTALVWSYIAGALAPKRSDYITPDRLTRWLDAAQVAQARQQADAWLASH